MGDRPAGRRPGWTRALRHSPHHARLLRTEAALRAALGVSKTALKRWIERGNIPVTAVPGSTRLHLEAEALIELLDRVKTRRDRGRRDRGRLLAASVRPPRPGG